MNERIRELIKQHGLNITIDGLGYGEGNVEGLAELIVRECATMTRNLSPHGELAERAVKEHFGVDK